MRLQKLVAILQGVLANGMDLTVLQFVRNAKDSCFNAMKPECMDDVPDDD